MSPTCSTMGMDSFVLFSASQFIWLKSSSGRLLTAIWVSGRTGKVKGAATALRTELQVATASVNSAATVGNFQEDCFMGRLFSRPSQRGDAQRRWERGGWKCEF